MGCDCLFGSDRRSHDIRCDLFGFSHAAWAPVGDKRPRLGQCGKEGGGSSFTVNSGAKSDYNIKDLRVRNLTVNGERLWASLMELAQIGATEKGGVCRLAASDLDGEARRLFIRWCEEAGCTVTADRIGNIFARRSGRNPDLPPVMTGSHLDTQPTGGRFDGAYGVIAGLEVVRSLHDFGHETEAPVGR